MGDGHDLTADRALLAALDAGDDASVYDAAVRCNERAAELIEEERWAEGLPLLEGVRSHIEGRTGLAYRQMLARTYLSLIHARAHTGDDEGSEDATAKLLSVGEDAVETFEADAKALAAHAEPKYRAERAATMSVMGWLLNELDREGDAARVWDEVVAEYASDSDTLVQAQVGVAMQGLDLLRERQAEDER